MSYRIRPGLPLGDEVARVARKQYDRAIDTLRHQQDGPHEAIHAARKSFKNLRGLFRLVRDADPEFFARENARVRDIARPLSEVRDAKAMVEALDRLFAREATPDNAATLHAIRTRLAERHRRIVNEQADLEDRIEAAILGCESGIKALAKLNLPKKPKKATAILATGAAKNYGRAVLALDAAGSSADPDDWHDLRKRIKYHWMHVKLLSRGWPGEMAIRAKVTNRAGEALGEDNDLANLGKLAASHPDAIGTAEEIAILRTVMAAQSVKLHAEVRDIVKHLLKDDEKLIRHRIAALWRDAAGSR
ncbi:CHAD domain-containing protein [uncultured Hoeflea sp.]|uniref:CHAD domain-containing protein n=1 Tax=uncultured Hoeflea sp. TaxID=538666 RepID=UPI0030DAE3DB